MSKSANSKLPCLNCKKKPVFALAEPFPSCLYTNPNWLPGVGASSYITSCSLNAVLTISNAMLLPATDFENVYNGTSFVVVLNLYCSVGMPCIVAAPSLLPNSVLSDIAELRINTNCSAQLLFVGSFHFTVCCDKSLPLLSIIFSVVDIVLNFNKPLDPIFLFAL